MSNEINTINGEGISLNQKVEVDNESILLANKLYGASLFYAECLGKSSLSKYSEDFHQDILTVANEVRLSKDPTKTVQFYLERIEHTASESGKTNNINPDSLKTAVSIAWRQITDLALTPKEAV